MRVCICGCVHDERAGACGVWPCRHLSKAVLVQVVVEMEKKVVFACELDSQRQRVLLLAHDQDLYLDGLQRAPLTPPPTPRATRPRPASSVPRLRCTRRLQRARARARARIYMQAGPGLQSGWRRAADAPPAPSRGGRSGCGSQTAPRGHTARGAPPLSRQHARHPHRHPRACAPARLRAYPLSRRAAGPPRAARSCLPDLRPVLRRAAHRALIFASAPAPDPAPAPRARPSPRRLAAVCPRPEQGPTRTACAGALTDRGILLLDEAKVERVHPARTWGALRGRRGAQRGNTPFLSPFAAGLCGFKPPAKSQKKKEKKNEHVLFRSPDRPCCARAGGWRRRPRGRRQRMALRPRQSLCVCPGSAVCGVRATCMPARAWTPASSKGARRSSTNRRRPRRRTASTTARTGRSSESLPHSVLARPAKELLGASPVGPPSPPSGAWGTGDRGQSAGEGAVHG